MRRSLAILFTLSMAAGCAVATPSTGETTASVDVDTGATNDPHSAAQPWRVRTTHANFVFNVDFESRQIRGTVTYELERIDPAAPLRLDTRDLDIGTVARIDANGIETPAIFRLEDADPVLGRALEIDLAADTETVRIDFITRPEGSGLQWLAPAQTAGKSAPFLYSQSQAIHARTWWPCQDTPGVRLSYEATVRVPSSLVAAMSAGAGEPSKEAGVFRFRMAQPIPPYLVALAVGDLKTAAIGARAGVLAEPVLLERAANELADLDAMMTTAESLYGPYRWDTYHVLFLPPAFPFGGMENPRMTFATPTILAGDRSLVGLIAHELAHSWSGNLVTNVQWSEIWLNEGFTTYFERRLMEGLYGAERAHMEWSLGYQDLAATLEATSDRPETQWLHIDLTGQDPDAGLSDVAYEKGALFLRTLEHRYGRENFDAFLRAWFDEHAFTSVTTAAFIEFANARLLTLDPVDGGPPEDLERWIHGPGVPDTAYLTPTRAFAAVDELRSAFLDDGDVSALAQVKWSAHEWLHFLRTIPTGVATARLDTLDAQFDFTHSTNYELLAKWLEISIREAYPAAQDQVDAFLMEVGRRKFLVPLYRALAASNMDRARAIYERARPGYHAISRGTLDEMLGVSKP